MEGFSDRLKLSRVAAELTQEALAKKVGVTRSSISQWENGQISDISGTNLIALASALDVDPAWLVNGRLPPAQKYPAVKTQQEEVAENPSNRNYKEVCPQTERERVMLKTFRELSSSQQAHLQEISDTFAQPIAAKKANN